MEEVRRKGGADALADKRWDAALIGQRIRELRKRCGMTQKQLADSFGAAESAIRNYESGKAVPRRRHIVKMAKALDVPPESLIFYDFDDDPDIVCAALHQIAEVYGFDVIEEDDSLLLVPTGTFMKAMTAAWEEHYRLTKMSPNDESMRAYRLWEESFTAPFDASDFPKRYIADGDGKMKPIENWVAYCLASRLKRIRKARKMTQAAFADYLGISAGVYRSYEYARRLPKVSVIESIARRLGVTTGSLTFFDFDSPIQASHALFQLEHEMGLHPEVRGDGSCLISCHLERRKPKEEPVMEEYTVSDRQSCKTQFSRSGLAEKLRTLRKRRDMKEVLGH